MLLITACSSSGLPGTPQTHQQLAIQKFLVTPKQVKVNQPATFSWQVSGPKPLTCTLEVGSKATPKYVFRDCLEHTSQVYSYKSSGTYHATLTLADAKGAKVHKVLNVVVTAPKRPVAHDDFASTQEGEAVTIAVLKNDTDPEGSLVASSVTIVKGPQHGAAKTNPDGTVRYQPGSGFSGSDSFSYTVADKRGLVSNEAMVTVGVSATGNSLPSISSFTASPLKGAAPLSVSFSWAAHDPDGDALTCRLETGDGASPISHSCKSFSSYTHDYAKAGSYNAKLTVDDGQGGLAQAVQVISVQAPPKAADDSATTASGVPVKIAVLANDTDGDGTLSNAEVTIRQPPGHGTATVGADNVVTYTSNAEFSGIDTFSYQFTDDNGLVSNEATVTITVTAADTPPTVERWSDAATWNGTPPAAGEVVTIPAGETVLLDTNPPPLGGLKVEGTLIFADQDLALTTDWLEVMGKLQIGSETAPFKHKAVITLTGDSGPKMPGMNMMSKVHKAILVEPGGDLELHGQPVKPSWTRLAATAQAGDTKLTLAQTVNWQPGDHIVIASTDFDFKQAEERVIASVSDSTVTLTEPLDYMHWGTVQTYGGHPVDERAEVGLLTRNILIQGDAVSEQAGFGGNLMVHEGAVAHIENSEFYRMGQKGALGRYPIHFHRAGDETGSYVKANSIHHSYNRCITIHGTYNVQVIDNVAYDDIGHCYFLEDGIEHGNVFEGNLGLLTKKPDKGSAVLPSDDSYLGPATFWITNSDNVFKGNVAAGSAGTGFWIALPKHPAGPSADSSIWPRRTPLAGFSGNVAHSNLQDGLHVDDGPTPDGTTETASLVAHQNPADPKSPIVTSVFEGFTAYKNSGEGAWLRGGHLLLQSATLADNAIGVTFASNRGAVMKDSVVIGETANLGTPQPWERTGLNGRSLPRPWDDGFAIRGFDFYDTSASVQDSYFAEFVPNSLREASALSYLDFTDYTADPENSASGLSFGPKTNRVYFASRQVPSNPNDGEDGYRSAMFYDADGSVTGAAGRYVTVNNPFLTTPEACAYRKDWNAWVCGHRFASFVLDNFDGTPVDIAPVTLSRSDGPSQVMLGVPKPGPNTRFRTNLMTESTYAYSFSGPLPGHFQLRLEEVKAGDWILVSLPYPTSNVFLYRDYWIDPRNLLEPVTSLGELQGSTGGSYYYDGSTLFLKLYVQKGRNYAVVDVCRQAGCP
jgi:cell migration-inducing and hyaluronan-binding protein